MSDVVERTLSALPGLLGQREPGAGLDGGGGGGGAGRSSATSRLGGLIRSITALASKHVRKAPGLAGRRGSRPGKRGGGLPPRCRAQLGAALQPRLSPLPPPFTMGKKRNKRVPLAMCRVPCLLPPLYPPPLLEAVAVVHCHSIIYHSLSTRKDNLFI